MGYDLYITRQNNWYDKDDTRNISIDEWKKYVASDPEMRLDNFAEATTTAGETLNVQSDGLSVWTKYSGEGLNGNHAWFEYYMGSIVVKNPDDEIINKMMEMAITLDAQVIGDEGETYEGSKNHKITSSSESDKKTVHKKLWWKFW